MDTRPLRRPDDGRDGAPGRLRDAEGEDGVGLLRRGAVGERLLERLGDLGRIPLGRLVPGNRRALDEERVRRPLVSGLLRDGLPVPPPVHRRPAPPVRGVHDPGFRRGAVRQPGLPEGRGDVRPLHRLLLHDAPDEGGGRDDGHDPELALLGRDRDRRHGHHVQRRLRRDEGDHLRPGVPVLGQAVRDLAADLRPGVGPGGYSENLAKNQDVYIPYYTRASLPGPR